MKILILAAGYATRLYPLTKHWPKPLLVVKEKPIISHITQRVKNLPGTKEIIVVTNGNFIGHFKAWARDCGLGKRIVVLNDNTASEKDRLGAIGDIEFAMDNHAIDDDLLVIGGDNLFAFDLEEFIHFAQSKKSDCSVGLYDIKNPDLIRHYGVVTLNKKGQIVRFQEKPHKSKSLLISMCIYYFPRNSLGLIKQYLKSKSSRDAPGNYINWLHRKHKVWGYVLDGVWYDIGDIVTFYHATVTFKD